jgi:hypothetical protein
MTLADAAAESPPAESAQRPPSRALELTIKISGSVVAVLAALFSGLLEIFWTTLRVDGYLICVSIVAAVVGNYAIAWFTVSTVGRVRAIALPGVFWVAMMLFAAGYRTHEGDYLIAGDNYVALGMIFCGSVTWAIFAYRTVLKRLPPVVPQNSAARKPARPKSVASPKK